jgi:hypothetical protein
MNGNATRAIWSLKGAAGPPNKGMKLTKPERIGALQLIPGVLRTIVGSRGGEPVSKVVGFGGTSCCLSRPS